MADKLQQGKFDSFTIVNNGLIETELLTEHEKIVYIVIRKHLNQEKQTAFPGMATIARESRISKSQVLRAVKGLEEKGLLVVKRQTTKYNEKKTNIYSFNDFADLWKAKTIDELKKITAEPAGPPPPASLTDDEIIHKALQIDKKKRRILYNQLEEEFNKEKELASDSGQTTDTSTRINNFDIDKSTTNKEKSQAERYTMEDIKALYEHGILIMQYPDRQTDIDIVMDILYDILNSRKKVIRIGGEDKPAMVVISRLMKLQPDDLIYSIEKYHEQTERIKNVRAYMLTILFNSREQKHLDLMNLGHHNGDF